MDQEDISEEHMAV